MPHRALRQSQLIEFPNAAAGHPGVLADKSGAMFVKPCKQAETDFYESAVAHPDFKYYIPLYYGKITLTRPDATAAPTAVLNRPAQHTHSSSQSNLLDPSSANVAVAVPVTVPVSVAETTWTPSDGREIVAEAGAVMENVTNGYAKPNVLDVKLGARLWADDAPPAKRQKLDKVSDETTSRRLGFRVAGMKVWAGTRTETEDRDSKGYKKYDKHYGRNLTADGVHQGFRDYFVNEDTGVTPKLARKVIKRFLMDLRGLAEVLEKEESRMYSASLLFVYEGDGQVLAEKFALEKNMMEARHGHSHGHAEDDDDVAPSADAPAGLGGTTIIPIVETTAASGSADADADDEATSASSEDLQLPDLQCLKMIDFAHAAWTPGQGADENVLHGVRSVIRILEGLIE